MSAGPSAGERQCSLHADLQPVLDAGLSGQGDLLDGGGDAELGVSAAVVPGCRDLLDKAGVVAGGHSGASSGAVLPGLRLDRPAKCQIDPHAGDEIPCPDDDRGDVEGSTLDRDGQAGAGLGGGGYTEVTNIFTSSEGIRFARF